MKAKKVVLIQGAFDILNYGHVKAFKFAKSQGDYLIVAINSNSLLEGYKRREPTMPWWHKKRIIESISCVDKVVKAPEFSPLGLLKKYKVDVYVISREHKWTKSKEIAYMKGKGGKVCLSRRFNGVSTTEIKLRLVREYLHAAGGTHTQPAQLHTGRNNGAALGPAAVSSDAFISGQALCTLWERQYGPFGSATPKGRRT